MNKLYLKEFEFYDGEEFILFNILGICEHNNTIDVAVTDRGKISVVNYDILLDKEQKPYFEYGVMLDKIYLNKFKTI